MNDLAAALTRPGPFDCIVVRRKNPRAEAEVANKVALTRRDLSASASFPPKFVREYRAGLGVARRTFGGSTVPDQRVVSLLEHSAIDVGENPIDAYDVAQ